MLTVCDTGHKAGHYILGFGFFAVDTQVRK
jgi:hypothetical protein